MLHAFLHILGLDDPSGRAYLWWSGPGADLGELGIITGLYAQVKHHNCHTRWCPRVGRFPVVGTPFATCRRHHPDDHVAAVDIAAAHAAARDT